MEEIRIFESSQFGQIRTAGTSEEPLFCLADVCKALGLTPKGVNQRLSKEVISNYPLKTAGGTQQALFVNEDGLYDVILDSRKPEAKAFRKWVTSEVLPSIRKHGAYATPETIENIIANPDNGIKLLQALKDEREAKLLAQQEAKQQEQRALEAEQVIKEQQPKVLFADSILASKTSCLIGELAKMLTQNGCKIGQNKLFKWLRGNGYLCTRGEQYNLPQQKYVDCGFFEIKKSTHSENEVLITTSTTKVTPKGQQYFINKFLNS
jgi:prophage antirepressor-like protein